MRKNKIKDSVHVFSTRWIITIFIIFLSAAPVFSANVIVPAFEIYTWGRNQGSGFQLDSYGDLELQLEGGYKFGASLMFDFTSSSLEVAAYDDTLSFKSASITLRELFNLPLNFTYFIGQGDTRIHIEQVRTRIYLSQCVFYYAVKIAGGHLSGQSLAVGRVDAFSNNGERTFWTDDCCFCF